MNDELIIKDIENLSLMPAKAVVTKIASGSVAEAAGIEVGDLIIRIDGQLFEDLIDYQLLTTTSRFEMEILKKDGQLKVIEINKRDYDSLGVYFASSIFTPLRSCNNQCIFCFVDQLPPNFRETIYVKDDDYRLSFLEGSYITLTNLNENDWRRIERLRLSPLYISVHTTSPELRVRMLKNPAAAFISDQLSRLARSRIEFHTQIVLCPGINDGDELNKTLEELALFWPYIKSVGIVPVGLTKHRDGLYPLRVFSKEEAKEVVAFVERKMREYKKKLGYSLVFLADEFYQLADLPFPCSTWYEGFPQLENGIGIVRSFEEDLLKAIENMSGLEEPRDGRISLITGEAGAQSIEVWLQHLRAIYDLNIIVHVVRNRTFGDNITVTGLVTGNDIIDELSQKDLGDLLLIPSVMIRKDYNVFLDDVTIDELEEALEVPVQVVAGAHEFLGAIFDLEVGQE